MEMTKKSKAVVAGLVVFLAAWATHYYTVTRFTKVTSLMSAARAGDAAGVERELRRGADPNRVWNEGGFRIHGTSRTGVTPLLFALESGGPGDSSHASVVKALLAAGADPCAIDSWQSSALMMAINTRDLEAARALWESERAGCLKAYSARAVQEAYRALSASPEDPDNWKLAEYLIDHVAQPGEADHPGALVAATDPAARFALERLIARGVKADGESLILASIYGKADLIPWLVEHGADINASVRGYSDEDTGPPLVRAAENPNASGVAALIDAGADVNAVDAAGRSALMRMLCHSSCTTRPNPLCEAQLETARLLLARGARRDGTGRSGQSVAGCVSGRRIDPYRADLQTLLGVPAPAQVVSPGPRGAAAG